MSRARDARFKSTHGDGFMYHSPLQVARHHAVTVPSNVPVGYQRNHCGGHTGIPDALRLSRGESYAIPWVRYATIDRRPIIEATAPSSSAMLPKGYEAGDSWFDYLTGLACTPVACSVLTSDQTYLANRSHRAAQVAAIKQTSQGIKALRKVVKA